MGAATAALALAVPPSAAQTCDLVHDFVQAGSPGSSQPTAGSRVDGLDDPAAPFVELAGYRYFRATTLAEGSELWRTDGTAAGTQLVCDLMPGPEDGLPEDLVLSGGSLYFTGVEPSVGRELFRVPDPGAYAKDLGPDAVSGTLDATTPSLGGAVQVDVLDAPVGSLGLLVMGPAMAEPSAVLVQPGQASWIDPLGASVVQAFAGVPFAASYPVPATPALAGAALNLQAWFLPVGQPLPALTSNGMRLVLGN